MKPTLVLICGLPGAGKTTLARKLSKEMPATILNPDEEMVRRKLHLLDESARSIVEAEIWSKAKELLTSDINVILDNGFWSRNERDSIRLEARQLGVGVRLQYLDVPLDELWKRVKKRNKTSESNGVELTLEQLKNAKGWMQPPSAEELELFD